MTINTIAVANRKGGVGKTTTAVNVASVLGETQRVLLVDLDTQKNASLAVGVRLDPKEHSPVFKVLTGEAEMHECYHSTEFGFDLLPASADLASAIDQLRGAIGGRGRFILREAIAEVPAGRWDTIILDCPPAVGDVTDAALIAAQSVLIPMVLQKLPFEGLAELIEQITTIRKYYNPKLKLGGVFSTLIDDNTRLAAVTRGKVEDLLETEMMAQRVRRNNALAEAQEAGKPVFYTNPTCNGAKDYRALVGELLARKVA
jgi:chromosome partitioning protein